MDKEISNVGTQYIICECGDNFPNEKFLNIHLANGHGEVETFQCDVCPEVFTSANALNRHIYTHQFDELESPKKPEIKTYSRKAQPQEVKQEKKPPVIKLKNLKRIDSISLIQNLKTFSKFIKIEPQANTQKPEPKTKPEPELPEPEPEPELPEPEPELPEPESEEPESIFMEVAEEEGQVIVKNEKQETAEEETEEIYYQCDVCNSIFYTEFDFNIHYQSAHALKLEPGTAEQILARHLATEHAGVAGAAGGAGGAGGASHPAGVTAEPDTAYYYECELCHKIFASEKYFNIHYNKTHGVLPTVAEESENEEASESVEVPVVEDVKPKAPEQVIYYKCDLCKILYPSEKAYNLHFEKKHGGQSCLEMQTGFQLIEQELTEDLNYSPPPLEEFTCEFCPRTFTMKRSLQVHRKRVHLEQLQLPEHVREPARAASRSKVCDVCGRAYNSNAALRYHQRRHTGEKPYPCTVCPKRFTMPMFLQIHMRTHTGEKPYVCPHCPKAFTNKAALIRHDRIHTGERPFKCGTCGKGFISKAMLNRHVRVHTGVKPYACPECGKLFTQSNSMKLHVSTVHLKLPAPYKSKSRRSRSEARARQLARRVPPADELVLGE